MTIINVTQSIGILDKFSDHIMNKVDELLYLGDMDSNAMTALCHAMNMPLPMPWFNLVVSTRC